MGLYPGSFDPFHVGHLDIVHQAIQVFDRVLVSKGVNPDKHPNNRYDLPFDVLRGLSVQMDEYDTLLTDHIKRWEKEEYDVTLVRGLRNGADLEYEQNLIAFLKEMYPQIKVVAFYCDPKYRHISSSALRGIEKFSYEEFKKYAVLD